MLFVPIAAAQQPLQQIVLLVRALGGREHREAVGALRVAQPQHLLRGETRAPRPMSPRGTARTSSPASRRGRARRRSGAIEQRELLQRIELRAALVRLRLLGHDHPRTVAPSPLRGLLGAAGSHDHSPSRFTQPLRMSGFVRRSRCIAKSKPKRPFTHVEPMFGVVSSIHGLRHALNVVAAHLEIELAADAAVRAHAPHLAHRLAQRLRAASSRAG